MAPENISFAYVDSEGQQFGNNVLGAVPGTPSSIIDVEIGSFPEIAEDRNIYVQGNNENNFSQGEMIVYKRFENGETIVMQEITFEDFNADASINPKVKILGFGSSDQSVKMKIKIVTAFEE